MQFPINLHVPLKMDYMTAPWFTGTLFAMDPLDYMTAPVGNPQFIQ